MILEKFRHNIESLYLQEEIVALAVSGGCDSVALLMLMNEFVKERNIKLLVLHVDHNLRPESKDEMLFVKDLSAKLGHDFISLSWCHQNNMSNLQARARSGRYDLMSKVMKDLGIRLLLTAHHQDDMIETYLMRKNRSDGLFGLKSSKVHFWKDVRVARPLFDITKAEIINYLQKNRINWLEDSSNKLDKYERNRVRKNIITLDKSEIIAEMSGVTKQVLLLNQELISAIAESVSMNNFGFAKIDLTKFITFDYEIQLQLLNYVLTIVGGSDLVPRYRNMKILLENICNLKPQKRTLHGCVLEPLGGELLVYREVSAIFDQVENHIWDNRFYIKILNDEKKSLSITTLGTQDYAKLRKKLDYGELPLLSNLCHKKILFTLPVIKNLEKVVAIPHISYYDDQSYEGKIEVIFHPIFLSRFTHFF